MNRQNDSELQDWIESLSNKKPGVSKINPKSVQLIYLIETNSGNTFT